MTKDEIVQLLLERFRKAIPSNWRIEEVDHHTIRLIIDRDREINANITRIFELIEDGEPVEKAIDHLIQSTLEAINISAQTENITREEIENHSRMVIRQKDMYLVSQIARESLLYRSDNDETCVLYVVDRPNHIVSLDTHLIAPLGLVREDVEKYAYQNMKASYHEETRWEYASFDTPFKIIGLSVPPENNSYTSSFALLEEAWNDAKSMIQDDDIIGILPTSDLFLACKNSPFNRKGMLGLAGFLHENARKFQKPVSKRLWQMSDEGLRQLVIY